MYRVDSSAADDANSREPIANDRVASMVPHTIGTLSYRNTAFQAPPERDAQRGQQSPSLLDPFSELHHQ